LQEFKEDKVGATTTRREPQILFPLLRRIFAGKESVASNRRVP
jgi:hypothetical protein